MLWPHKEAQKTPKTTFSLSFGSFPHHIFIWIYTGIIIALRTEERNSGKFRGFTESSYQDNAAAFRCSLRPFLQFSSVRIKSEGRLGRDRLRVRLEAVPETKYANECHECSCTCASVAESATCRYMGRRHLPCFQGYISRYLTKPNPKEVKFKNGFNNFLILKICS